MFYQKIIGTLTLLVFSMGILFSTYTFVSAYTNPQDNIKLDGIVTAKTADSITVLTTDSETIQFYIEEKTVFTDKLDFEDIKTGDRLKIHARDTGSEIIAKVIKRVSCGSGYGNED